MAEEVSQLRRYSLRISDVLAFCLLVYGAVHIYQKLTTHIDDFYIVNAVLIPDHSQGSNPHIIYDRIIFKNFSAYWTVKIVETANDNTVCSGSGYSQYDIGEKIENMKLDWFVGAVCNLAPGSYIAKTKWKLDNKLELRKVSNMFEVIEKNK